MGTFMKPAASPGAAKTNIAGNDEAHEAHATLLDGTIYPLNVLQLEYFWICQR